MTTPDNNELAVHRAKLEAAYRAGHSGHRAVEYASLIQGDTVEAVLEHSERLSAMFADIAAAQAPVSDRPTDHSQGHGNGGYAGTDHGLAEFREMFSRQLGR